MAGKWHWPGDADSTGDTKGWDRVSIAYNSRPRRVPNVSHTDLVVPTGPRSLRTLGICVACSVCITILYVWIPLIMVNVFAPLPSAAWYGGILAGAALALTVALFAFSTGEDRAHRELARNL